MTQSIIIGTTIGGESLPPLVDFIDFDQPHKVIRWPFGRYYLITASGRIRISKGQEVLCEYGDEPGCVVLNESRSFHLPEAWIKDNARTLWQVWRAGR